MRSRRPGPRRPGPRAGLRPCPPRLEALEDRRLLATFVVDNPGDIGLGSLRQAIVDANATPGADSIIFALPNTSTVTLTSVTGALPRITDQVTIDGTTQPVT
ncbi:MAG TPA: hypothetical protein VF590_23430, partial [Isosphaeraceae bacterium]